MKLDQSVINDIRAAFAECEAAQARYIETKKAADLRSWKRKGDVLEVVCVGHMRKVLDELERLRALIGGGA